MAYEITTEDHKATPSQLLLAGLGELVERHAVTDPFVMVSDVNRMDEVLRVVTEPTPLESPDPSTSYRLIEPRALSGMISPWKVEYAAVSDLKNRRWRNHAIIFTDQAPELGLTITTLHRVVQGRGNSFHDIDIKRDPNVTGAPDFFETEAFIMEALIKIYGKHKQAQLISQATATTQRLLNGERKPTVYSTATADNAVKRLLTRRLASL